MGNYEQLKQSVSDVIKANGNQEITGDLLQRTLLTIISTIGANATFAGLATPDTNPGTPDQNVFYIADIGTYPNFDAIETYGLAILYNENGSWNQQRIMPVQNNGVRAIINTLGMDIEINTIDKTITIPTNTRAVALEGTVYNFNAKVYDIPQDTINGVIPFTNIFYEKETGDLVFQSYGVEWNKNYWWGQKYFWIGCLEITPYINNIIYLISPKYKVDGKYYGYYNDYQNNSGVKRIINIDDKYILFDTQNNTITIPLGTRCVDYNGNVYQIKDGTYQISTTQTPYTNIFVKKESGELYFQQSESTWDKNMWNDMYFYIGSYENIPGTSIIAYLLADIYIVDGEYYGVRGFSKRFAQNSGVKRIICPKDYYIEIDTESHKIIIPKNVRVCGYNQEIYQITPGEFNIPLNSGGVVPYTNIFVKKTDGSINFQTYMKSWDINLWGSEYFYIGSLEIGIPSAENIIHILSDRYIVDGVIIGKYINIMPQMYNAPIIRKEIGTTLKMCCFGSSWFMDTWWYLNKILQSAGINAELTCFYTGGAYFSQWIDRYNTNASVDCWKSINGANWNQTTANFKDTLNEGWDIIAFQQGAWQSIEWSQEWEPYLTEIASIVKRSCRIDTVIAFNSTWTPAISGNLSPYQNTIDGQKSWQKINYQNVQRFMNLTGINNVSPNGATMWSMRRNSELNISGDMASDGVHPDNGLPIYALAGTFFETFIAPMYGISFDSVEWMPDESTQKAPVSGTSWQPISESQRNLIRSIIKLSLSNRFGFNEL